MITLWAAVCLGLIIHAQLRSPAVARLDTHGCPGKAESPPGFFRLGLMDGREETAIHAVLRKRLAQLAASDSHDG